MRKKMRKKRKGDRERNGENGGSNHKKKKKKKTKKKKKKKKKTTKKKKKTISMLYNFPNCDPCAMIFREILAVLDCKEWTYLLSFSSKLFLISRLGKHTTLPPFRLHFSKPWAVLRIYGYHCLTRRGLCSQGQYDKTFSQKIIIIRK